MMAQVFVAIRGISKPIGDPLPVEEAQAFVKRANAEESRTTNREGKPIRVSESVWYWKYVPEVRS